MVTGVEVDPNDVEGAVEKALRVLNAATQTRLGLTRKLERAGFAAATATRACDRVEAMGYVNDRAYAEAVLAKRQRQGRGVKVIAAELRHKGIDTDLVEEIIGELSVEDEVARAAELADKLLVRHRDEPLVRQREHVMGGLLRRGYAPWVAKRAIDRATSAGQT
jgi:regulatory protein